MFTHVMIHRAVDRGFRSVPLLRFQGKEDGFLSQTHDGARLFLNLEDYMYYNHAKGGDVSNTQFKRVIAFLRYVLAVEVMHDEDPCVCS